MSFYVNIAEVHMGRVGFTTRPCPASIMSVLGYSSAILVECLIGLDPIWSSFRVLIKHRILRDCPE